MTLKKDLENRVRGWIPQKPSLPKSQMKAATPMRMRPVNIWNPLWIAPLFITLIFFTINYFVFQIPIISTVIAIAVVDIAVVLSIARKQKNRVRIIDLGWVPKEPHMPSRPITASPENMSGRRNKIPKGEAPRMIMGTVLVFGNMSLSVSYFLHGDALGALFLWFSSMLGASLALNAAVLRGKEFNPKLVVALTIAIVNFGSAFATLYIFSVPASFLLRAFSLGMLVVAQIPLLFAVIAYVWGKKELSKKLMGWFITRRA